MSDFMKEANGIDRRIDEVVKRVRGELAVEKARQRAEAEAIALPYLRRIVDNVELAAREEKNLVVVMSLEGELALRPGHENAWDEATKDMGSWYMPNCEAHLAPAALVMRATLIQQKLRVLIAGPKDHPRMVLELPPAS